jgi:deazaflavin-dependent oxidoreductase (nitroreductase family)
VGSPLYDRFWGTALTITRTLHHGLDKISGGRLGKRFPGGAQVVWIHTLGRKSGQWRRTALLAAPDGDTWVIAGSNAGQEQIPAWVYNIRSNPDGELEISTERTPVRFVELEGAERDAAYQLLVRDWGGFAMYARNAKRTIPVFRLVPVQSTG